MGKPKEQELASVGSGHPASELPGRGGRGDGCPQGPARQGQSLLVLAEVTECLGFLGFPGAADAFHLPVDAPGLAFSTRELQPFWGETRHFPGS